jgi:hypothetical protein
MSEIRHCIDLSLRSCSLGTGDHCIATGLFPREWDDERRKRHSPLDHWSANPHYAASGLRMTIVRSRVSNFRYAHGRNFTLNFR